MNKTSLFREDSVFAKLSSIVTVEGICSPLGVELESEMLISDAVLAIEAHAVAHSYNPAMRIALVMDSLTAIGWLRLSDMIVSEKIYVQDVMVRLTSSDMISQDMTALRFADLIAKQNKPFFVVGENKINGTVGFENLFHPTFRVCLFSETLDLEEMALNFIVATITEPLSLLSEGRRHKALNVCKTRYGERAVLDERRLVFCTAFVDKGTIIKCSKMLNEQSGKTIQRTFKKAEQLRNYCAHPTEAREGRDVFDAIELLQLLEDIRMLKDAIRFAGDTSQA